MSLVVGKIYRSKKRDHINRTGAYHPFVFLFEQDEDIFIGAMLTSQNGNTYNNYPLSKKYFIKDPRPKKESYFVPNVLVKKHVWSPFDQVGQISEEGVEHILTQLADTNPISFEDFRLNIRII